jgi:hypothetical protein
MLALASPIASVSNYWDWQGNEFPAPAAQFFRRHDEIAGFGGDPAVGH